MNYGKILFLDIETVSGHKSYEQLSERLKEQWKKKSKRLLPSGEEMTDESAAILYEEKAAIWAEFGKIVCISFGFLHNRERSIRIKSIASDNEYELLCEFKKLVQDTSNFSALCGHNIKEFDVPYICRRMLINHIQLPPIIDIRLKKPWELQHIIDTMDLWKFGDYKHYTSLDLLTAIFNIETPKDDIDGSQVSQVYYKSRDINRIAQYCEKDVIATINVFLKLQGMDVVDRKEIEVIPRS